MSTTWRSFFDAHAPSYDENPFTANTVAEVDFIVRLYAIPAGASILDIGCGTGRHAIELAVRGFHVTGVDFSRGMLDVAEAKAASRGVDVRWVHEDARTFALEDRFDAAICLCEGAPGLLERGEDPVRHDRDIFLNVARHLKQNAPFVLTALNGYSAIRQMTDQLVQEGRFDPATMVSFYPDEWDLPDGKQQLMIYERLFIPPEMVRILQASGFAVDNVYGGTAGHWAQRPVSLDEVEAMYICRKA